MSGRDSPSPPPSPSQSPDSSEQTLSEALMSSFSRLEIAHARQQADLATQFNEAFSYMSSREDIIATQKQRIEEQDKVIAARDRRIEAQAGAATRLADGNNDLHRLILRMSDELDLLVLRRKKLEKANDLEDVAKVVSKYRKEADGIGKKPRDPSRDSQTFVPSPFVASIANAVLARASAPAQPQPVTGSGASALKSPGAAGPGAVSQATRSDRKNAHSRAQAALPGKGDSSSRATNRNTANANKKLAPGSGAKSAKSNNRTAEGE